MQVEFVLGRAGSGKTTFCYGQIEDEVKKGDYRDLMMLVPEQFNLQTQIDLSKRLYPGLFRVEVISFNTLAREVFKETGKAQLPVIDDLERIMILKKIVEDHKKELIFFRKNIYHTGFIESINRLITVFEQDTIDDSVLQELITDELATPLFKSKFHDIQLIYKYFEAYIKDQFITAEKTLSLLAQTIYKSNKLSDAMIWVDGFYGFTHTQIAVIKELIRRAKCLKITLPADRSYGLSDKVRETNPFYESIKTYQKLINTCEDEAVPYTTKYLLTDYAKVDVSREMAYLEQYYLDSYVQPFKSQSDHLHLALYANKNEEIEQAAKTIIELVRDSNYRYRDIAVIVGDLEAYKSGIQSIFNEYDIPYFLDMKKSIHNNSLIAVIEGVLEVITSNYSYKSMMTLLRTYMLNSNRDEIDILENYILAYDIKGKKKWHQIWAFDQENAEHQRHINKIRENILKPIDQLEERIDQIKLSGKIKVTELTKSVYYFLEDIHAYEQVQTYIVQHQAAFNRLLELENSQIWDQVIDVFERLVAILGEEYVTTGTYKKIVSTSFSYLKMGIIPPSQDQVIIGTIDRTRLPRIKAVFILGTNEGVIPRICDTIELFSDMDKVTLNKICKQGHYVKEKFCDTVVNQPIYSSNFSVYTALTRATEKLYISAVLADENGKSLRPSLVYYKIKKLFYSAQKEIAKDLLTYVNSPLPTFGYVGKMLREYIEGRVTDDIWKDIVSWYCKDEIWHERLLGLSSYLFYTNQQHYLDEHTTKLLYGTTLNTSISKLESFRSCACCYFIRYGIKAEERKLFTLDHAKIGTLFHAALEQYPKELDTLKTTWKDASKEQIDTSVKNAALFAMQQYHIAHKEAGKLKYTTAQLEKMTKRAIYALTAHLKNSEFIPVSYEVSFAEGKVLPPIQIAIDEERKLVITGQIDRVDVYYKDLESNYIKILDYKTGNKNFNLLEVYYGLQLQLLLYLDTYLKLNKEYKPGGVFYFHISNPYINYQPGMTDEEIDASNLKQFKLSGLALEELDVIYALDKANTGMTIPVNINKDGTIKKGSSVASEEQFKSLENHIINTIKNLGKQILEGKVSAKPFSLGDKNPCLYCKYHTICQFNENEPDNMYDKLDYLNKETIWEKLCTGKENG
ncbi:PD-(D/E)XK nuclease family protein [Cellulosilyticum sp. I15G10I2]|uniref:PD-(D/E)XK nuclease family protein n=1 Tax=Cellulosilyticum sp. I15G10I2 TaxID=1892843 RepID=UPI00085CDC0D|nr:PD-(D/E)XK nuclease family protein [Cellulosilyticum sp. I15G10I2]